MPAEQRLTPQPCAPSLSRRSPTSAGFFTASTPARAAAGRATAGGTLTIVVQAAASGVHDETDGKADDRKRHDDQSAECGQQGAENAFELGGLFRQDFPSAFALTPLVLVARGARFQRIMFNEHGVRDHQISLPVPAMT